MFIFYKNRKVQFVGLKTLFNFTKSCWFGTIKIMKDKINPSAD